MKQILKKIIQKIIKIVYKPKLGNIIINKSRSKIRTSIFGTNNYIEISKNCILKDLHIWIEGDNNKVTIGEGTTVEQMQIACVGYEENKIIIGNDCMFSSGIRVVNTDSHSIISLDNKLRINPEKDVVIGNHVWVGADSKILKGVTIGDNSVIAMNSVVTKDISCNCIYGGVPAKLIKENITWDRKRL